MLKYFIKFYLSIQRRCIDRMQGVFFHRYKHSAYTIFIEIFQKLLYINTNIVDTAYAQNLIHRYKHTTCTLSGEPFPKFCIVNENNVNVC